MTVVATPKLKVLISGAGIAGPCLAYWLARSCLDITTTIVERSPVPRATGQAIDIRGPAVEILKKMQLEEAVRSRHTTEEGTSFVDSAGKPYALFKGTGTLTSEYEILRADLSELFLDATKDLGNVHYKYGDFITSLDQTYDSVRVMFDGGFEETYDVVVAADGSTSKTRSMILDEDIIKDSYDFSGQYVGYFSIPRSPQDTKYWHWYNAPGGLCAMLRPHRTSETMGSYLAITTSKHGKRDPDIEAALKEGTQAQKSLLRQRFENTGWEVNRILNGMDAAEDFYMSRTAEVKLSKWTNGRALVLGDAANAIMGIGTSLAIESSYILAGELSKIKSAKEVPRALEAYEKLFRSLHAKDNSYPKGLFQLMMPQTSWGLSIRDSVIWTVSSLRLHKLLRHERVTGKLWEVPEYNWRDL